MAEVEYLTLEVANLFIQVSILEDGIGLDVFDNETDEEIATTYKMYGELPVERSE